MTIKNDKLTNDPGCQRILYWKFQRWTQQNCWLLIRMIPIDLRNDFIGSIVLPNQKANFLPEWSPLFVWLQIQTASFEYACIMCLNLFSRISLVEKPTNEETGYVRTNLVDFCQIISTSKPELNIILDLRIHFTIVSLIIWTLSDQNRSRSRALFSPNCLRHFTKLKSVIINEFILEKTFGHNCSSY